MPQLRSHPIAPGERPGRSGPTLASMIQFLIFLLIAWVAISVIGFVIEGLLWLGFVGLILFAGTAVFLWIRRKANERR